MVANIPLQKTPIQMLYNAKSIICTYLTVVLTKGVPVEPTVAKQGRLRSNLTEAKRRAVSKKPNGTLVKGVPVELTGTLVKGVL